MDSCSVSEMVDYMTKFMMLYSYYSAIFGLVSVVWGFSCTSCGTSCDSYTLYKVTCMRFPSFTQGRWHRQYTGMVLVAITFESLECCGLGDGGKGFRTSISKDIFKCSIFSWS